MLAIKLEISLIQVQWLENPATKLQKCLLLTSNLQFWMLITSFVSNLLSWNFPSEKYNGQVLKLYVGQTQADLLIEKLDAQIHKTPFYKSSHIIPNS